MAERTIQEQLVKYLTDAHAIEEQALAQMRAAPDVAGDRGLAFILRDHLLETEGHEARVRERLEAHGEKPSTLEDTVMKAGGTGLLIFAGTQPDTPGKLAAHAFSYEHLELGAYELLIRVAERAGDAETAETARGIREEERNMAQRLAASFDKAVDASLRDLAPDEVREQLVKYLADAHALEGQGIQLLERAPKLAGDPELEHAYADHLDETRAHQRRVRERLEALGGETSTLEDAGLRVGGLNWSLFFEAQPDTPGKLAAFVFAFEHLEIAGYEQLGRVARRARDDETLQLAARILDEERPAAERIASGFDLAVEASLEAQGVRS